MVEVNDDRPLPRLHCLDAGEGKRAAPLKRRAPANDDLVGLVGVSLVTNGVEPAEVRAVARLDPMSAGGGKQTTELCLSPQALLDTLIPDPLSPREESVVPWPGRQAAGCAEPAWPGRLTTLDPVVCVS